MVASEGDIGGGGWATERGEAREKGGGWANRRWRGKVVTRWRESEREVVVKGRVEGEGRPAVGRRDGEREAREGRGARGELERLGN